MNKGNCVNRFTAGLISVLLVGGVFLASAPLHFSLQQTNIVMFIFSAALLSLFCIWINFLSFDRASGSASIVVILFVLFVVYLALQIMPVPGGLMSLISPQRAQIWNKGAYGINGMATLSLDITATIWSVIMFSSYLGVFVITLKLSENHTCFVIIMAGIFLLGVCQVLFDILTKYYGYHYVSMSDIDGHGYRLTGTFVNSNNLSALLNLSVASGLALVTLLARQYLQGRRALTMLLCPIPVAGVLLLIYGNIQAGSSGGFLALMAAAALSGLFLLLYRLSRVALTGFIVLAMAMIMLLWQFGSQELNMAQIAQKASLDSRIIIWKDVIAMWKNFPLFGIGAGAFEWIFPIYKSDLASPLKIATAHSGYMHFLAETGIAGVLLLLAFLVAFMKPVLTFIKSGSPNSLAAAMCMTGVLAFLIQELVETNLLIPGVAIPFFTLLALVLAMCTQTNRG